MIKPFVLSQRPRRRVLLLLAIAISLLVWLFVQADTISIEQHHDYTKKLFLLQETDAELNAAVLASRYGLHHDFDLTTQGVRKLLEITTSLHQLPRFLGDQHQELLQEQVAELQSHAQLKADTVDRFKRETSILRNSVAYFPVVTNTLIQQGVLHQPLSRRVGIFGRSVMTYVLIGNADMATQLRQEQDQLQQEATALDEQPREQLLNLLAHATLILDHKPLLDRLTQQILEIPTSDSGDRLTSLYAQSYNQIQLKAQGYRIMLLVAAVILAGYLGVMITRQRHTALALADANSRLNERIETLHRTQAELKRYATVFLNASEGMLITDDTGRILAVNPAFTAITGYGLEDIAGKTPAVLSSGRQDASYYREMWNDLIHQGHWEGEIWNRRRNGEIYPEWLSIVAVRDHTNQTTHYIGIFSDVTERKKAEARIRHLAHHDALTGLPNRLLLQDRLEQAIRQAQRNNEYAAVLFFDLDRFKLINDTLGHEIGDGLLRLVAQRCQQAVRETDTVARQGGDEFVVVLPNLKDPQDAGLIARKILAAITQPCHLGIHELTVTCSIGIAVYPEDGTSGSILLRNADAAMYRAKASGRNCYQFYTDDMNTANLGELLLEQQLRGALDRGELRLHYQPKVDARNLTLRGCEALIRWQHPEQGLLSPDRFIPVAEESGLIVPIGKWVIYEACRQIRAWIDAGLEPVPVAVNLSSQQFTQQDLVALVREALDQYQLPPHLLELELTETMLMRDVGRTIDTLAALSAMGVSLAIDDFGTGYSSLAYLRQFKVNSLKIDRSFVHDIYLGTKDAQIATAVIALAHSLGLQVTAEGVETEDQRHFLANHRCDYLQGYLFGKPEPSESFSLRLTNTDGLPPKEQLAAGCSQ